MSHPSTSATAAAAFPAAVDPAPAIVEAARLLLPHHERGQRIDAAMLRAAMEPAFGASDADDGWDWKAAYDACEAATVLLLRKYGPAMRAKAASLVAMLPMLAKVPTLLPTHTHRSEESEALQEFSTPIPLGYIQRSPSWLYPHRQEPRIGRLSSLVARTSVCGQRDVLFPSLHRQFCSPQFDE